MSYFEKGIVILLEGKKLNISGFPDWAYYLTGAVFLMGGLISFYCFKKTQQKTKNYKKLQLKIFRSENRAKRKLSYKEAGLKLPIG